MIAIGRLVPVKGFDRLLKVMKRLHDESFNFELWLLGDGEQRTVLEYFCANNNLTNIRFLGFKGNPYPYIKKADLLVCSSYLEGYSTTVCESVVLGTPVVTTECSGMREILDNGKAGDIVDNSEEGLFKGLKRIMEDPSHLQELTKQAKLRSVELQSSERLSKYIDILS